MDQALLLRITEIIHARASALEMGWLNVIHVLDRRGIADRADTVSAMRYTAENLGDDLMARDDIVTNIERLIKMIEHNAAPTGSPPEETLRRRRELFRLIEGGRASPDEEN